VTDYAAGRRTAARPAGARSGVSTALLGVLIVVAAEGTLFGCFIATYYYLRFTSSVWPPPGSPKPAVVVPLILLAVLVATSVPMHLVSAGARAGRLAAARRFLALALVVQCGYFAYEAVDFHDQITRFDISRNAYSSIYYVVLGADHAHVLVGILLNVWLLGKLTRGLTRYRVNAAQAIAWYWFAVNALTVFVVLTLLSARL
jgi:cytochrome c oxidase subunit III